MGEATCGTDVVGTDVGDTEAITIFYSRPDKMFYLRGDFMVRHYRDSRAEF